MTDYIDLMREIASQKLLGTNLTGVSPATGIYRQV
jgi:hypothetical protein